MQDDSSVRVTAEKTDVQICRAGSDSSGILVCASAVHRADQNGDVFGIDIGRDAVAEVEDVAGMRAEIIEHAADFAADYFG